MTKIEDYTLNTRTYLIKLNLLTQSKM